MAGAVLSAPLAGGEPTTLAAGQKTALGIATDGASVYWIDEMMISAGDATVMKLTPK